MPRATHPFLYLVTLGTAFLFCLVGATHALAQGTSERVQREEAGQITNEPPLSSTSATVTVVGPNGGETWTMGEEVEIEWTSQDVSGDMMVDLYRGDGVLVDKLWRIGSRSGSISWTVRSDLDPGSDYYIQIRSFDNPDVVDTSDRDFTIQNGTGPQITPTYPGGGDEVFVGEEVEIEWTSQMVSGDVNIYLYQGYAENRRVIAEYTPNDGSHTWTVPSDLIPGEEYYIFIGSQDNGSVWGDTDFFELDFSDKETLALSMTARPDPVRPGQHLVYEMTVTNRSSQDVAGVELRNTVPGYVEGIDEDDIEATCAGFNCYSGETLLWSLGTLPAGESRTVVYAAQVKSGNEAPDDGDVLSSRAAVYGGASTGTTSATYIPVDAAPALTLGIVEDQEPVRPGQSLTYRLTYANPGPVSLSNVTLRAPLPDGVNFASASSNGQLRSGAVEWNLGTVEPGGSGQQTFTVNVNEDLETGRILEILSEVSGGGEQTSARAAAATVVQGDPPLALSMTARPDPVRPGQHLVYEMTVTNRSSQDVAGVELRNTVPGYVEGIDEDDIEATCAGFNCYSGETLLWSLGTLPAGESRTVVYAAQVKSGNEAPPDNVLIGSSATVSAGNGAGARASTSVRVDRDPHLALGMTEERDPAAPSETITYTLLYANPGAVSLSDVTLRAQLPEATSFASASGGGIVEERIIEWDLDELSIDETGLRSFEVNLQTGAKDEPVLTGQAAISSSGAVWSVAQALTATSVQSASALSLAMTTGSPAVQPDGYISYEMTVTNRSSQDVAGVELRNTVPGYVEGIDEDDIEATCAGFNCYSGETLLWDLGTLPAGESRTFNYAAQVKSGNEAPEEGTLIGSSAAVYAENRGGATASADVVVGSVPAPSPSELSITSVSPNPVTGSNTDQPLTVRGNGFEEGAFVILDDTEDDQPPFENPDKTTFVSSTELTRQATFTENAATWTAVVENPGGQQSEPFAFEVVAPGGGDGSIALSFPTNYQDWTPYTAEVTSVFDHAMNDRYCPDDELIVSYTNERGTVLDTEEPAVEFSACDLHSYKKSDGTAFVVNGNYVGSRTTGSTTLNYDNHPGYDYRTPTGTDVIAAATGEVVEVNNTDEPGSGKFVKVQHGEDYRTLYLHLSEPLVSQGATVTRGQTIIGKSGATGGVAAHLHFEVRKRVGGSWVSVDPYGWEGDRTDPYTRAENINLWAESAPPSGGACPTDPPAGENPTFAEISDCIDHLAEKWRVPGLIIRALLQQENGPESDHRAWAQFKDDGTYLGSGNERDGIGLTQITQDEISNGDAILPLAAGIIDGQQQGRNSFTTSIETRDRASMSRLRSDWAFNLEIGIRHLLAKKAGKAPQFDTSGVGAGEAGSDNRVLENWYNALAFYNGFTGCANNPGDECDYDRNPDGVPGRWKDVAYFPYQEAVYNALAQRYSIGDKGEKGFPENGIEVTLPGPEAVAADASYDFAWRDYTGSKYLDFYAEGQSGWARWATNCGQDRVLDDLSECNWSWNGPSRIPVEVHRVDKFSDHGALAVGGASNNQPATLEVNVSQSFGGADETSDYRLVALPGAENVPLTETLTGSFGAGWKAFRQNESGENLISYRESSEGFHFAPGTGFWIIAKDGFSWSATPSTVELDADGAYTVALHAGWNIISNPFGKDVNWSAVQDASGAGQPLWSFAAGSYTQAEAFASAQTGQAYYFFNQEGLDELVLPYHSSSSTTTQVASTDALSEESAPPKWALVLTASRPTSQQTDADTSRSFHATVRIGETYQAEAGFDVRDHFAPPSRFETVSLRLVSDGFEREDVELASEYRPPEGEGQRFDLVLRSAPGRAVTLYADLLQQATGQKAVLVRPATGEHFDLRRQREVRIIPKANEEQLALLVGSQVFVEEGVQEVAPSESKLLGSYPNPFREKATIAYALAKPSRVRLTVYDILGRRIRTLVDEKQSVGRKEAVLDARTLSSGVYLFRLRLGDRLETGRLVHVR